MKRAYIPFLALPLSLILVATVMADDLPATKRARGESDATLSGANVYRTRIAEVIARLGPPTKINVVPDTSNVAGGCDHVWKQDGLKVDFGTWNDKGNNSVPYSIEVWGNKASGEIGSTGKGLKLGETLEDVYRIYGHRLELSKLGDGGVQVTIQWNDDTTLYLYLSKSGHINHMHLLAATD